MQRPIGRSHKAYTDIAQIEQMLTICLGVMIMKCWIFTKALAVLWLTALGRSGKNNSHNLTQFLGTA